MLKQLISYDNFTPILKTVLPQYVINRKKAII